MCYAERKAEEIKDQQAEEQLEKTKIECQICGWVGTDDKMVVPFSNSDPGCPSCGNDDFLEVEDDD